jgi:hypothetical protein
MSDKSVLNAKQLKRTGEGSYLRQQYPGIWGALQGAMGVAPDELDGSVLDPSQASAKGGAEMTYLPGLLSSLVPTKGAASLIGAAGTIAHPFLKPSVALSKNAFSNLATSAEKSAMTKYQKLLGNDDFLKRELMRENGASVFTQKDIGKERHITPEDMFRSGNVLVPVAGDTSRTGRVYQNVNGVPLSRDVAVQGGYQYSLEHETLGTGNAWSSMEDAAMGKQSGFNKAAKATGTDPRAVFFSMNPTDSIDFSSPVSEMYLAQLDALKPSAAAVNSFNENMLKLRPNFVGLTHPNARDQLLGINGFPADGAGAMRVDFAKVAKAKNLEWKGLPSYDDIHAEVTHPSLANSQVGDSGLSTFLAVPGAGLGNNSMHNSYNRAILGSYDGGLPVSIPAETMFPDMYYPSLLNLNKAGEPLSHAQAIGNVKMSHGWQVPDQQWLDGVMPVYERLMKERTRPSGLLGPTP